MHNIRRLFIAASILIVAIEPFPAMACGGFFCTTQPINQAAEQIVFHQDGNQVTAMVRILYTGEAEDFSWVVPVPDTPEISLGADATFNELEFATRPQFNLLTEGNVCEQDMFVNLAQPAAEASAADAGDGGVQIEEELTIGPFDIDIVSSDNADDMSIWLEDNGYFLDDRGRDLIEPYVLDGMKFVAVKLRSGESSGSIQPLIMQYPSEKPMIPIRLTAVAAQDDMGVLVWVVNDARAIPENYEHVTPNYTKLDWYSGSFNAYLSYQNLITEAMDEAGGQGFATDYAGGITADIRGALTDVDVIEGNLALLDAIENDAEYLTSSLFINTNPSAALANISAVLPLPEGQDTNLYFDSAQLAAVFTPAELSDARIAMRQAIVDRELTPIADSVALLPQDAYLTRLFTTLSASDMTVDPTFNFNSNMPEQSIQREALLNASCENGTSQWSLTLGSGTGREGEKVLEVNDEPIPFLVLPTPIDDQPSAFLRQRTSANAEPELLFQAESSLLEIGAVDNGADGNGAVDNGADGNGAVDNGAIGSVAASNDDGFLGAAGFGWLLIATAGLWSRRWHSQAWHSVVQQHRLK